MFIRDLKNAIKDLDDSVEVVIVVNTYDYKPEHIQIEDNTMYIIADTLSGR